ncbi:hypothetical protein Tco_1404318 [Tanacetum coccineum]
MHGRGCFTKDLISLSLDELIGNLKVHKMIIKKDSEIVKANIRETTSKQQKDIPKKSDDREPVKVIENALDAAEPYFILMETFPKPTKDKNQKAFVGGSWSDYGEEDDEKVNNETCLVAQASSKICLGVDLEPDEWIKDSRCSKHITGTTALRIMGNLRDGIETVVYTDSDHAGDYVDRKSTSGICTFVGCCLTSWFSKKQTTLAISTTELEYVSAGKACQQAL